jgi:hypothetical protein
MSGEETLANVVALLGTCPTGETWRAISDELHAVHRVEIIGPTTYHSLYGAGVAAVEEESVVVSIQLFGPGSVSECGYYSGVLPSGLTFGWSLRRVCSLLGAPVESGEPINDLGGSARLEPWTKHRLSDFSLHLAYAPDASRILLVSISS